MFDKATLKDGKKTWEGFQVPLSKLIKLVISLIKLPFYWLDFPQNFSLHALKRLRFTPLYVQVCQYAN